MVDFATSPLSELGEEILRDGVIDAGEAAKLRERLFADGRIDQEEADFLFLLNDAVSGKENDPAWQKLFVSALTNYVLADDTSPGTVDQEETAYLMSKIQGDGKVDSAEMALLVNIVAKAKATSEEFQRFVAASLKTTILADGTIDEAEVTQLRTVIYGTGGAAGAGVDRAEAELLFELNDATSGAPNHPSWTTLFVEAIAAHLLEDEASPGVVDEAEGAWLLEKVGADGKIDDNEKALLAHLKDSASELAPSLKEALGTLGI
jgi:hypothetical protein